MSYKIDVKEFEGSGSETFVVDGAILSCTLGTRLSELKIPNIRNGFIKDIKRANIADHIGGYNILSFGNCYRADPPPACIMATYMKWIIGKTNVLIDGEEALQNISLNLCACGGVISIVKDGQP